MRTSEKVFLGIGSVSFFVMLINIVLEFFSVSVFLGSKKLISYIGIFLIITAVSFSILAFLIFKNHAKHFKNRKLTTVLKVVVVIFSVFICFSGFVIDGFLYTDVMHKDVSSDRRHTLIVEKDPGLDEWHATVYRRYNFFLMSSRDSEVLIDMVDSDEDISIEWTDDSCKMSYDVYKTNAVSASDTETVVQKLFYSGDK